VKNKVSLCFLPPYTGKNTILKRTRATPFNYATIDKSCRRIVIARRNNEAILQRSLVETESMLFPNHSSKIASYLTMTTPKGMSLILFFTKKLTLRMTAVFELGVVSMEFGLA